MSAMHISIEWRTECRGKHAVAAAASRSSLTSRQLSRPWAGWGEAVCRSSTASTSRPTGRERVIH
jgi:hypothetical protein